MQAVQWMRPGDILLYNSGGFAPWWIKFKTWEDVSHAEWYLGGGLAAGSRGPTEGTKTRPVRLDGLAYILRPNQPCDLAQMRAFHESCIGQKYDWIGLIKVFYGQKAGDPDRAYCSEHVARCFKIEHGGCGLFQRHYDCDKVSPGMLKSSAHVDLYRVIDGNVEE